MIVKSSEKVIYFGLGLFSLFGIILTAFLIYKASRLASNNSKVADFSSQRTSSVSATLGDSPADLTSISSNSGRENINVLLTLDFGTASKEAERLATYSGQLETKMSALDLLTEISQKNNFTLESENKPFGAFVRAISGVVNKRNLLWIFYYNGRLAPVSPDKQSLRPGDRVEFRYGSAN